MLIKAVVSSKVNTSISTSGPKDIYYVFISYDLYHNRLRIIAVLPSQFDFYTTNALQYILKKCPQSFYQLIEHLWTNSPNPLIEYANEIAIDLFDSEEYEVDCNRIEKLRPTPSIMFQQLSRILEKSPKIMGKIARYIVDTPEYKELYVVVKETGEEVQLDRQEQALLQQIRKKAKA